MNALERLREIGPLTISKQTHISVEEIQAILDERYDRFNRTKAVGFIKILEREYEVKLDEWLEAFDTFNGNQSESEEIFVYAKSEEGSTPRIIAAVLILLFVGAVAYYFWSDGGSVPATTAPDRTDRLVSEAKSEIERNTTQQEEALTPVETQAGTIELDEPAMMAFYVKSDRELWVGVYYSESGQREGRIIEGRYDLDAGADQVITFGHGHFTLVHGQERISPGNDRLHRFRYRDGVLTPMAPPRPARQSRDENSSDEGSE